MPTPDEVWFRAYAANTDDTLWLQEPPGTIAYVSPRFEEMFGHPVKEVLGDVSRFFRMLHPDDRERVRETLTSMLREPVDVEYRIVRPDGQVRWIADKGFPMIDRAGDVRSIAGIARDITEAKETQRALVESEAQTRLLLAELQHRVRNTLGVIRSIARRTAERARDVEEYATHLDGRLAAFARVQALVTRAADARASLREIIEDELLAHAAQEGATVNLEGPDVLLETRLAERLSLAVHELTANAVKHGVLGGRPGRLDVRWLVEASQTGRVLGLKWRESGLGRSLRKPRKSGFGAELLTRSLAYELNAKSAMHFGKDGFSYTLFVPLPHVDDGERKSEEPRP